ncbi:MAG: SDR family NAD(P)-dependent oxidoreductase, partial [Gammaproteobacteria bacterium]|nr:SDR family NAD(P)-dependent oxidoreductase [Gammaproteobacteria bacterium]
MSINIEGLKFVITGGAAGMGAATAKLAAGYGASVVIADLNEEKSRAVVDEIRSKNGRAWYKQ